MSYQHLDNLSTTASQDTSVPLKAGSRIALQALSGTVRCAFGKDTATATTTTGLRVFADQPPLEVQLLPHENVVAVISEDGTTACTVTVLDATAG
jgi:hypothetical protein